MSFLDPVVEHGRIRIEVSTSAALYSVTRKHPSGAVYQVRNMTLQPLSDGVAVGWDYEAPIGEPLVYTVLAYDPSDTNTPLDTVDSAPVTWDSDHDWLKDPLNPVRNTPVLVGDMSEYTYEIPTSVHRVLGRPDPVTIGDVRQAATGDVVFAALDQEASQRIHYITSTGNVLLLQSTQQSGVGNLYLAPLSLKEDRVTPLRDAVERLWTLSYQEVASPTGDAAPFVTWADVAAQYATWQAIVDAGYTSWLAFIESLAGISDAPPVLSRGA